MPSHVRYSGATPGGPDAATPLDHPDPAVLRVFADISVVVAGVEEPVRGQRTRQVLSVLAFHRGRPVPDDVLGEVLWADAGRPNDPAATLRTYVGRVRTAVPHLTIERGAAGYLLAGHGTAWVLDVDRFADEVDAGLSAWQAGDSATASAAFTRALAHATDRPWAELEDWPPAASDRVRLAELARSAREFAAAAELVTGPPARVVGQLRVLTEAEPLREFGWELLMRALYEDGRAADALRAYQELRRQLVDELGVEPSDHLRDIEGAILRDEGLPALLPSPAPGSTRRGRAARPSTAPGLAPLAGRAAELDTAQTTLDEVVSTATARVLDIMGDPGIGKTRLLGEIVRRCEESGFEVVSSRAFEGEASGAYRTMGAPLRALLASTASGTPLGRRIAALLAGQDATGVAARLDGEASQLQLFDVAAALVQQVAQRGPLVVVLDDIQWADPPSLDLLAHVLDVCGQEPVLVVVAHRQREVDSQHPAARWLARMARRIPFTEISLRGLDDAAAAELVAHARGTRTDDHDVISIVERCGGNPFFCLELARAPTSSSEPGLPPSIDRLLTQRCAALGPEAADLLRLVSCASGGLPWELATHVMSAAAVGEPLDALVGGGFVVEVASDDDVVLLPEHDLLRASVIDDLSLAQRLALHRRLAEAADELADRDPNRWVETAAYHWFAAGRSGDPARAAMCNRAAGRLADQRTAFADARVLHDRARQALGWAGRPPDVELLIDLATACHRCGDLAGRVRHARAAFDAALVDADLDGLGRAALVHAGSRSTYGKVNPSTTDLLARADAALAAGHHGAGLAARVRARLAQEVNHAGALDRSRDLSAQAVDLALGSGDEAALAQVFRERIWTLNHPDFLEERERTIAELVERANRLADVELEMEARIWAAAATLERGDSSGLDHQLELLESLAAVLPIPGIVVRIRTLQTTRASMRGDHASALELANQTFELGSVVEPDNAEQVLHAQLIAPMRDLGQLEAALPVVMASADHYRDVPGWRCALAFVLAEAGDHDAARDEVARLGRDGLSTIRRDLAWAQGITYLADAVCTIGERDLVDELIALIEPFSGRFASLWDIASNGAFDHYLARLHATAGRWEDAAVAACAAFAQHRASRHEPMELRSAMLVRDVLGAAGSAASGAVVAETVASYDDIRARATERGWTSIAAEVDRR